MSFGDRLVLWLHIAFAIFTIGPIALAVSSTPRYIRRREVSVLRYLSRITMIFTAASLLVLVFGVALGQIDHAFSHPWLSVSLTLFVVAIVLLILIMRDQRRAIRALSGIASAAGAAASGDQLAGPVDAADTATRLATTPAQAVHVAAVERGRIAAIGGIVNLLWLVVLVLMVWRP